MFQVTKVIEDEAYVFSLDYGFTEVIKWNTTFLITPDMKLKAYPPQARLCHLQGTGSII